MSEHCDHRFSGYDIGLRCRLPVGHSGSHNAHPSPCKKPPPGWECSRVAGHDGPCAASALNHVSLAEFIADLSDKVDRLRLVCATREQAWRTDIENIPLTVPVVIICEGPVTTEAIITAYLFKPTARFSDHRGVWRITHWQKAPT